MAIGTAAAIGIGLAGAGAVASGISGNKASKRAAETSENTTAANIGLARESRDLALNRLDPFTQRGDAAGNQINALLGLGGAQGTPTQQQTVQPNALSQFYDMPPGGFTSGGMNRPATMDMFPQASSTRYGAGMPYGIGDAFINYTDGMGNTTVPNQTQQPGYQSGGQNALGAQNAAFDNFRNSTAYEFTLGEGMDALNSGFAGSGMLQSGARDRAAIEYGQNMALQNAFMPYMGLLQNQQAVGAGTASSGAGVTQNFAANAMNSNNFNAQNQMAAQLGRQNVFGNALGTIGGGILGYGL